MLPEHTAGGEFYKIHFHHFRHEGEASGGPQITLNDLHIILRGQELDIERPRYMQLRSDSLCGGYDFLPCGRKHLAGGELHRGIARMHSGVFDMFRKGSSHYPAAVRDGVEFEFLASFHKGGNHHRMLLGDLHGKFQKMMQVFVAVAYVHRCSGKNVGGANQYGEAHLLHETVYVREGCEFAPFRLVYAESVHDGREFVPVLGPVDVLGPGAQNPHAGEGKREGEIVRNLSAHAHHHAQRLLQGADVHHGLIAELVEIESVTAVVVGRDGLGIIVYHYGFAARLAKGLEGVHSAPVEFDAAADAISPGAEHDYGRFCGRLGE